jgi:phytoene dehydrogenase-like protein
MYTQTGMPSVARASAATQPHAIVIGSGFGGLAAAVRLGARGYRVTVLEKLDAPGGRAYVYRQDGFTFDAGPTVITAPFLLEELWALCGKKMSDDIDLRPVSPVLPHPLRRRQRVRLLRRRRQPCAPRSPALHRPTWPATSDS